MEGPGSAPNQARERLRGAAAVKAHVTLALGVAFCGAAFWFEVGRALGGNELSWAYVFEWPLFAVFAVYMWWKVLHPEVSGEEPVRRRRTRREKPAIEPEFAGMLAAWQESQRELEAQRTRDEEIERARRERAEAEDFE